MSPSSSDSTGKSRYNLRSRGPLPSLRPDDTVSSTHSEISDHSIIIVEPDQSTQSVNSARRLSTVRDSETEFSIDTPPPEESNDSEPHSQSHHSEDEVESQLQELVAAFTSFRSSSPFCSASQSRSTSPGTTGLLTQSSRPLPANLPILPLPTTLNKPLLKMDDTFNNSKSLPKLKNALGYYAWRSQSIDIFLQKPHKVWRIIDGKFLEPNEVEDPDKHEQWATGNDIALGLIRASLSPDIRHEVENITSAREIWLKLEKVYSKSMHWLLEELEHELNGLRQGKHSINGFVGKIKEICDKLLMGGISVPISKRYNVLIKGLNSEYDSIRLQIQQTYRNRRREPEMFIRTSGTNRETFEIVKNPLDENAEFDDIVEQLRQREGELGLGGYGINQRDKENVSAFASMKQKTSGPRRNVFKARDTPTACSSCGKAHSSPQCPHTPQNKPQYSNKNVKKKNVETFFSAEECAASAVSTSPKRWIIDSGSTSHICTDLNLFTEYNPSVQHAVRSANNEVTNALGSGTVQIRIPGEPGEERILQLSDTLYIPSYASNLISLSRLLNRATISLTEEGLTATIHDAVFFTAKLQDHLFVLDTVNESEDFAALATAAKNTSLWHRRLGHASFARTAKASQMVEGLPHINVPSADNDVRKCNVCETSKSHRQHLSPSSSKTAHPLELVHSDVIGKVL